MDGYCNLHSRDGCTLCDECDHESASHLHVDSTKDQRVIDYIYANSTCWAENVCRECSPSRAAIADGLAALPATA